MFRLESPKRSTLRRGTSPSSSCLCLVTQSCLSLCDPFGLKPTRVFCPWDFSGKNTGVGCHFLLWGIFSTQGSNPRLQGLLHCRWILYVMSHLSGGLGWQGREGRRASLRVIPSGGREQEPGSYSLVPIIPWLRAASSGQYLLGVPGLRRCWANSNSLAREGGIEIRIGGHRQHPLHLPILFS